MTVFPTKELVTRIAGELDCGFRCYLHKKSHEIITIPNEKNFGYDMDMEAWEEDLERLKMTPTYS